MWVPTCRAYKVKVRRQLSEVSLLLLPRGSSARTQVTEFAQLMPYTLSHLTGLAIAF